LENKKIKNKRMKKFNKEEISLFSMCGFSHVSEKPSFLMLVL
jgi:hypothetical protein